jgi:hypothetical protein
MAEYNDNPWISRLHGKLAPLGQTDEHSQQPLDVDYQQRGDVLADPRTGDAVIC